MTAFDDAVKAGAQPLVEAIGWTPAYAEALTREVIAAALPVIAQALKDEADRPHELGASLHSRGEQRGYRRAADIVEGLGE